MSEIKRYKVGSYRMAEHGDMVFYDDHQAALEAIMQQRDSYRHQATALNLLNEQLEERCAELERELEWMQIKYNTEMRIRQAYESCSEEMARKAFVAGANWWAKCELDDTLHSDEHEAASEYAQREYGIKEQP